MQCRDQLIVAFEPTSSLPGVLSSPSKKRGRKSKRSPEALEIQRTVLPHFAWVSCGSVAPTSAQVTGKS
jgi:hypothetical protein